jgi:hypothetical protein
VRLTGAIRQWEQEMTKWEYRFESLGVGEDTLNELGKEGWELVAWEWGDYGFDRALFKRPIQPPIE